MGIANGPQSPLPGFSPDDHSDWTAVVVNIASEMEAYLFPTLSLVEHISMSGFPDSWRLLHLHFHNHKKKVNFPGQYGLNEKLKQYKMPVP
jgi:hypothetical protein